ncbi:MAG TPA: MraY family glycosyltransferase [Bryobacteraceae bacterium]|jgi:UDP-GlcNAc:undecaprenyl-phosphate GlcNAc-1-phosphate transferase
MAELLAIPCISFALALAFTPLARALALRWELVDRPDGHRKLHGRTIPVAGGLAIFLATGLTLALTICLSPSFRFVSQLEPRLLVGLLLASLLICAVGVADDYGYLRGRHKLCGQIVAIAIVMGFGVQVRHIRLFGLDVELGLLSLPFTVFLLLGAINSLNLLDGMDGFLSSVGIIICIGIAFLAILGGRWMTSWVALALAGAILGFLKYNFPPASIFLGDAGSMLIGLVVGVLAIQSSLKGPATVGLAAPLALLTIPIIDTAAAIVRRKLTGRSLYTTDRGHLHHCLQRKGLSNRDAILLVGCLCLITATGAMASMLYNNEYLALLAAALVVGSLVLTRLFGHAEVGLVQKRLRAVVVSLFRSCSRREAHEVEVRLQGSVDWKEIWSRLTECAERLQLRSVLMDVNAPLIGEGYHARWDCGRGTEEEGTLWRTEIPLVARNKTVGRVQVSGERDALCVSEKVAVVAQVVKEIEAEVLALCPLERTGTIAKKRPTSLRLQPAHME